VLSHLFSGIPGRIPIAMLALSAAAVVGIITGPVWANARPFFWIFMEALFGGLGVKLDKKARGPKDLIIRGGVVTVMGLGFALIIGVAANKLARQIPLSGITEIILLSLVLSSGAVWRALFRLYAALKDNKIKGAYLAIARSTNTDLSGADDFTITRTGMGFAARSFDKCAVAPVFWYLIGGLPCAYIYAGLAMLSFRFGRDGFTRGFGAIAMGLEKVAGFIPSCLAGLFMALGGLFTPTGGMTRAFRGLSSAKGRAPYAEGGWPLTAMAWSLNVSLGGPAMDRDGHSLKRAWVGPENATARLEPGHLRRALYISLMAYLLFMAVLAGVMTGLELFPRH
jgi:adenosylcobinamide-phosphate synthase